ncbi:MAG: cytidylate kinase-like family protein [Gammaproteobacteria bacterium]|nr:cytidylate kinase-like family protein [Gammaproteobacteria bacterium]
MDIQKVIQTLIASEYYPRGKKRSEADYRPVVTLSRDVGSGGSEIASRLAKRLGVPLYDKEILDAIAERAKVDRELMARLDEKTKDIRDSWLFGLLSGQSSFLSSYRHHLFDVLLCIAQQGGVIVGRGAHIVLANREAFRLRVVGSEDRCADRVAARNGLDREAALERVRHINRERDESTFRLVHHHLNEAHTFDLVLNTDKLDDWDVVCEFTLNAMRAMGFNLNVKEIHG